MMGWGWHGGGFFALGLGLLGLLALAAVVVFVVMAASGGTGPVPTGGPQVGAVPGPSGPVSEAERILEERFARGEIDAEALARGREALRGR